MPIAGGESLSGLHEFNAFFQLQALDVVQPEVTFCGGIGACHDVLGRAGALNLRSALHTGGSAGPGLAASIHLSFAATTTLTLEHLLASTAIQNDVMLEGVRLRHGEISPPRAPGLGVEISEKLLAKYPYRVGSGEVT